MVKTYKKIKVSELQDLLKTEKTIAGAAREYCRIHNILYSDKIRRKISHLLNKTRVHTGSDTDSNGYSNDKDLVQNLDNLPTIKYSKISAVKPNGAIATIDEFCEQHGLNKADIKSYKLVTHTGIPFYNIVFYEEESSEGEALCKDLEFLDSMIAKYIKKMNRDDDYDDTDFFTKELTSEDAVDRLVITDVHINMNNQGEPNDVVLYKTGLYDKDEIKKRLNKVITTVKIKRSHANVLYIDNLGDFMDGLGGQTTRGGHSLPQLYSDKEAFEIAVDFQISLVEGLMNHYDRIILNNVINDNHGFMMSYFVHSAVKKILEAKYKHRVEYNIIERFMDHYEIFDFTFILTHGKDYKDMKFGMKLFLDANLVEKIDQYCKHYSLYKKGQKIELSKGDLHQYTVDCTAKDFDYVNYPSFSPPSLWVQTNFGNSRSGFVFQTLDLEASTKTSTVVWF